MNTTARFIAYVHQRTQLPNAQIEERLHRTEHLQTPEAEQDFVELFEDSTVLKNLERGMGVVCMADPNCIEARGNFHTRHSDEVRGQALPLIRELEGKIESQLGVGPRSIPSFVLAGEAPGQAEQIFFSDPQDGISQKALGQLFVDATPGEAGELWFFSAAG